jgi:hypothetical protein
LSAEEAARFACDFSYVSNASGSLESLREALAQTFAASAPALEIFHTLSAEIIARSRGGERFDQEALEEFVTGLAGGRELAMPARTLQEFVASLRTLADRCFRHATLEWVARYCQQNNRTLHLYGSGWESHPTLGAFAKGRIDPGDGLTAVYLASRINLQIIESGPIHSRFLDGIAAGGFFVIRESMLPHERPTADAQFALAQRAEELGITTGRQLLSAPDAKILRLWKIVGAPKSACTDEQNTAALRHWRELPPHYVDLPHIDEITFHDEHSFAAVATRYLKDAGLRARIAADLRGHILQKHSYDTRWRQFLDLVRGGLNGA